MKLIFANRKVWTLWGVLAFLCWPQVARPEALLQLFNVSYVDLTQKMPELAEAGYNSLWLPPPTKGSGGLSVGYDLWDPFDLGSKNQRNSVRTRYGTEAELLHMMEVAHRFGIRVYFDNIMNHRAFDVPGYNENTAIDIYPGMVPEDFHVRRTEDGFYRKWDNCRDWNSEWQVHNLGLADLIDIAHETPNTNHGINEGDDQVKYSFIRDFDRPEQYDTDKDGQRAYFGVLIDQARAELGTNATSAQLRTKAQEYINARKGSFTEDVGGYLIRAARWKLDRTKADGFRLDAVKHVPDYFFGQMSGADKDASDAGYLGGIQWQFNRTRGFSDSNQRNSVFEDKVPRDDAMVFGEHLGAPPGYSGYWNAGMRLVDNELRSQLNNRLGNPGSSLAGYDSSGAGGFSQGMGVTHANSHDSDYAAQKEWQHAYYMTREGMGLIYSDGYNKAETLGESGGAFPRHANTQYLGQFNDPRIPNILKIHNDFARGLQQGLWSDGDFVAFERRDNRDPGGNVRIGNAAQEVTMVMMMNDNTAAGQARTFNHSFGNGAYLFQYARGPGMAGFYSTNLSAVIVPPGGYFVFGWRTPELSNLWPDAAITLYQTNPVTGQLDEVPRITVTRKDGRDGDPSFNPDGLPNRGYPAGTTPVPYTYQTTVPVVKAGAPFTIVARADGSAENIMLKLDGGVNLNTNRLGSDPAWRDNPPGLRTDIWLGYEQPPFVERQNPEKFAAVDSARSKIGSPGAETYVKTIGGSVTNNLASPTNANDWNGFGGSVVSWHYHDPNGSVGGLTNTASLQLVEGSNNLVLWSKTPTGLGGYRMFVYYTTNGTTWPEGAGGIGRGETRTAEMNWRHDEGTGGSWWSVTNLPKPAAGTQFRYKIGAYQAGAGSIWPTSSNNVSWKSNMLTTFRVADFDPATVQHFPHNDYARVPTPGVTYSNWPWAMQTGLSEGFHVLRARAFLNRGSNEAPIYSTFTQTFYYDAQTPEGVLAFPATNGDTVGGSSYEMVVRTDMTVQEVWYRITDSDNDNDDAITRAQNGNGAGFEPFVDANGNRAWESGETFTDLNGNGTYDTTLNPAWAKATEVTPSLSITSPYQKEWRFTYNNIPLTGAGTITLRFLEASSSRNMTLSATSANVTEITRNVETRGNAERILIGYPANDGDGVDDNYVMQVWFPKTLSNTSISESQMIARFTFSAQGNAQDRTGWSINYGNFGPGNAFHQLSIPLPNLYNSALNQQEFRVVYQDPGDSTKTYTAIRRVVVNPSSKPFIRITRPTVVGSDGRPTEIVLPDGPGADATTYEVQVETSTGLNTAPTLTGITTTNSPTSSTSGNIKTWTYTWAITSAGNYTIQAEAVLGGSTPTQTSRNASVVLRQVVDPSNLDDKDDDNDGLVNIDESNRKSLPTSNAETWSNGDVHIYYATGKSLPTSPDSDSDGLPDGLEVGWRVAGTNTVTTADTNGDGWKNFIGDLDPPLYAVVENNPAVPGVGSQSAGDDRTRQAAGSVTDPANPDTDGDGIQDGVEDSNRNGWTDGDGKPLQLTATIAQYTNSANRPNTGDWPNNSVDSWETWEETSATKNDSDADGLTDGSEDNNGNGQTDILLRFADGSRKPLLLKLASDTPLAVAGSEFRRGTNEYSRAVNYPLLFAAYQASTNATGTRQINGWPKLEIAETDALLGDTDGDTLPDGWEKNNGLDPLDNGSYNFATGGPGDPKNGASGNPDNDALTNSEELAAGTHPNISNTPIGSGSGEGTIRIGQFLDWKYTDLIALDEYNEGGSQAADVYRTNTSDDSRDILAFSFRDGGVLGPNGDGKLYFRVDFMNLAPDAWTSEVDAYIVIDTGNPAVGEASIPNEVDITTEMKWEAVVAVYGQDFGTIFVDTARGNNTTTQFQVPNTSFGVESRGFGGLNRAQWSSTYDAVEISVDRQNLIDSGWDGDPNKLNFQVFTTRPNTTGSGTGDISGRNDIRDTIADDWLASDYWKDQSNIQLNGKLSYYFGRDLSQGNNGKKYNDRNRSAKVMLLAHGNQAIQSGGSTQALVHDRAATNAAGYHRLVATHNTYQAPLTLHLTPTLASSLEWAKSTDSRNDGPAFNAQIRGLVSNNVIDLVGTTFADHMTKYFPDEFNASSKALSQQFLNTIYGNGSAATSTKVFWPAERVLDDATLGKIQSMGYTYTFADQMRHFLKWFGRSSALGTEGFRLNKVGNVKIFPIHDFTSDYLNQTLDEGSSLAVRQLLSRRARSGVQDQVVVLWRDLNDFATDARSDSYDANVRWLASRPWIRVVTADQIANNEISYVGTDGNTYGEWGTIDRGSPTLATVAKDWVDWASGENYDNWFSGGNNRPGLRNQKFGGSAAATFGQVGDNTGQADQAWRGARNVNGTSQPGLRDLADSTLHSAMFLSGFHSTTNTTDLSKFSTGVYINPNPGTGQTLAPFARNSQAQARFAKIYEEVNTWSSTAGASTLVRTNKDIDLDGSPEYLLYNRRLFGVFEAKGGRMTAAWMRDPSNGKVWQVAGNFAAYSNTDTEDEGADNATAYRTSGFKDWWLMPSAGTGNRASVNDTYTAVATEGSTGWTFNNQSDVTKTITLASADAKAFTASYSLSGLSKAYIRFGLSPNLGDLLLRGQAGLGNEVLSNTNRRVALTNTSGSEVVRAFVEVSSGGVILPSATDLAAAGTTVLRRNQAQTHQVEVELTGNAVITLGFDNGVDAPPSTDGILDSWWSQYGITGADRSGSADFDGDGVSNLLEYRLGSSPSSTANTGLPTLNTAGTNGLSTNSFTFSFQTVPNVTYQPVAITDLSSTNWTNVGPAILGDGGTKSATDSFGTNTVRKFYKVNLTPNP